MPTDTGARSGRERTVPLAYLADGDRLLFFGSRAGSDKQPDRYWNLLENAVATVEFGEEIMHVTKAEMEAKVQPHGVPMISGGSAHRDKVTAQRARR
jgi:F420H(2)-dependent quinone reductase